MGMVALLTYPSGRPWLFGGSSGSFTFTFRDDNGVCGFAQGDLSARNALHLRDLMLKPGGSLPDLGVVPGSYHLGRLESGVATIRGTLSGTRVVAYSRIGMMHVVSSSARLLARLMRAPLNEEAIAVSLLVSRAPWPLAGLTPWQDVYHARPGAALTVTPRDAKESLQLENLISSSSSYRDRVEVLRSAIVDAVTAHTSDTVTVSTDVSGGLDSTAVSLAARGRVRRLVAFTNTPAEGWNPDSDWSERVTDVLRPDVRVVVAPDELPTWFTPTAVLDRFEAPFPMSRTAARMHHVSKIMADLGSGCHLSGIGGDELFSASDLALREMIRARPLSSWARANEWSAQRRWRRRDLLHLVASAPSYRRWYRREARRIASSELLTQGNAWEAPPRVGPWVTSAAAAAIRSMMLSAPVLVPHSTSPRVHMTLAAVQAAGEISGSMDELFRLAGVKYASPLLDDQVVLAALSFTGSELASTGTYKRNLRDALEGIAPSSLIRRGNKGEYSSEVYRGIQANRAYLLDLFNRESELVGLGLVDHAAMRDQLQGLHPHTSLLMALESTISVELWLRSLRTASDEVGSGNE